MNKNISIITNFGCRRDCWYCVWKGHRLEYVRPPTDWKKLDAFLKEYKAIGKVSISGGGDSIYCFNDNSNWWKKLFTYTRKYQMKVDIHTREKLFNYCFWAVINRCVFSSDKILYDRDYLMWLSKFTKIRFVHVATPDTTINEIQECLRLQMEIGKHCQFTVKQLTGHDDCGAYEMVKRTFPSVNCLDAGDYNIYYMPDNTVTEKFL